MRKIFLVSMLLLSGCASDNYVVIPNSNGSQERMSQDLHDCKMEAIHAYYSDKNDTVMLTGGALGGAIGGMVAGSIYDSESKMKSSDINPYIEKCMQKKGYKGSSK